MEPSMEVDSVRVKGQNHQGKGAKGISAHYFKVHFSFKLEDM